MGERVGVRMLELLVFREAQFKGKRELKVISMLNFIHTTVWKVGFVELIISDMEYNIYYLFYVISLYHIYTFIVVMIASLLYRLRINIKHSYDWP
jgi:hypothetical protein